VKKGRFSEQVDIPATVGSWKGLSGELGVLPEGKTKSSDIDYVGNFQELLEKYFGLSIKHDGNKTYACI